MSGLESDGESSFACLRRFLDVPSTLRLPTEKFAVELDAPIDVKECCGIGLSSVGRRRPRERHSV